MGADLQTLMQSIAERVGRHLERRGVLVRVSRRCAWTVDLATTR
jgi:ribosomal protein S25